MAGGEQWWRGGQINTIHYKLQAFLKLLEFRIIGSSRGVRRPHARSSREEFAESTGASSAA
jgi:hypothetical protein